MTKRRFKNYSDDVLAWWVEHMDNGGCPLCPSETPPDVAAEVRAEFARRSPNAKPRPGRKQK